MKEKIAPIPTTMRILTDQYILQQLTEKLFMKNVVLESFRH